ncbi:MAG: prepilin-type N-terminal cleavage/methylation domain-containing protein [Deltaproteobacteria bacterium]|nr:prepilin-type N-terminal cleavage/methylation domain-containing protein [Deltaproteobacteria bacterium]
MNKGFGNCRNRDKEGGFTLLELIVAISILTVGILAVASMQVASIRGNAFADGVTEGSTCATDRMEKLRRVSWDDPDLTTGSPHDDPSAPAGYSVSWTVTEDTPVEETKTIEVTVNWEEYGGQKTVTMQTVIPRIL